MIVMLVTICCFHGLKNSSIADDLQNSLEN